MYTMFKRPRLVLQKLARRRACYMLLLRSRGACETYGRCETSDCREGSDGERILSRPHLIYEPTINSEMIVGGTESFMIETEKAGIICAAVHSSLPLAAPVRVTILLRGEQGKIRL